LGFSTVRNVVFQRFAAGLAVFSVFPYPE